MKLYIRNMVSTRCKMIVESELEKLGIKNYKVELGEIEFLEGISGDQSNLLCEALKDAGLDVINEKLSILVEKIKIIIIELVHYSEAQLKTNLSDYISEKLGYNYTYLANQFSKTQNCTIEHFYLNHKIERVKELITYNELNISEIAYKMHYSSVAHLSNQFKRMTGLTPSQYKHLRRKSRKTIDNV